MTRNGRLTLTALALWTAAGPAFAAAPQARPFPAARAEALARELPQRLGLGFQEGLRAVSQGTDPSGRAYVRYAQTWRGIPVWDGAALAHLGAGGELLDLRSSLQPGVRPALDSPRLGREKAVARGEKAMLRGRRSFLPSSAQLVVFPTKFADGPKLVRDAQGRMKLDLAHSVLGARPSEPYVLAWHVKARIAEPVAGRRGAHLAFEECLVDAGTGALLKRWDGLQHADTPSKGTGNSQYSGTVSLDTLQLEADNSFVLRDTTRATAVWPRFGQGDPNSDATFWWNDPNLDGVGSQTMWYDPLSSTGVMTPFFNDTDSWGDGSNFIDGGDPTAPNGQTAAVDAHFGLQATWDYYKNVYGRNGIDDLGSSTLNVVHVTNTDGSRMDNASWSNDGFLMLYGDGQDFSVVTALDVSGHEMSHGVMGSTAGLEYSDESGGLNESNSDVHGTMVEFYTRAGGTGATIPNTATGANWTVGEQLGATPLRWMYRPSLDGASYDFWFDGIGVDDVHFTSGPGNRCFYFLANGTGSDADHQSAYLPNGMTGIGSDKAAHIWYEAVAHQLTDKRAGYADFRAATLAAAQKLYSAAEVAAVANAWAAVNVGAPSGGAEPVRVTLGVYPDNPATVGTRVILVPAGESIQLSADVANATTPGVTWSLGGLSFLYPQGGSVTADGVFTTPIRGGAYPVPDQNYYGFAYPVKATSKQDPKQFAVAALLPLNLDADDDTAVDACDLGVVALNHSLLQPLNPGADVTGDFRVDDEDLAAFLQAFQNAYGR